MTAPPAQWAAVGKIAAGYIRESSEDTERDLDAQKAGQREDVIATAKRDGRDPAGIVWYDDWGRSGSEHAKRPAQERLLAEVRAGRVETIYARSLDRLMRSTQRLRDLWQAAGANGTRIVTQREGDVSADKIESNPSAWMFVQSIMQAAEYESRVARVRAQAGIASKRRAGVRMGRLPYGEAPGDDLPAVLAAFDEAGTFLGAAKVLNARGVKTRSGRTWEHKSVAWIVRHNRTDVRPEQSSGRGVAVRGTRLFTRMLQCDCGTLMTSQMSGGTVNYYCKRAHHDPRHPRPYVIVERKVREWASTELEPYTRLVMTGRRGPDPAEVERQRVALMAKRARIIDMYQDSTIDKAERDKRLTDVQARLTANAATTQVVGIFSNDDGTVDGTMYEAPIVDMAGDPGAANAALHNLWSVIRMRHVRDRKVRSGYRLEPALADWQPGVREWLEGQEDFDALPF